MSEKFSSGTINPKQTNKQMVINTIRPGVLLPRLHAGIETNIQTIGSYARNHPLCRRCFQCQGDGIMSGADEIVMFHGE